jgi:hypothetical protein
MGYKSVEDRKAKQNARYARRDVKPVLTRAEHLARQREKYQVPALATQEERLKTKRERAETRRRARRASDPVYDAKERARIAAENSAWRITHPEDIRRINRANYERLKARRVIDPAFDAEFRIHERARGEKGSLGILPSPRARLGIPQKKPKATPCRSLRICAILFLNHKFAEGVTV